MSCGRQLHLRDRFLLYSQERFSMATRRKIDGDKVEHGEVLGITYDRP